MMTKESDEGKALVKLSQFHKISINGNYKPIFDYLIHIPNGGTRHPLEAKNLMLQGVKPGVSDYLLTIPKGEYHGAWIELKRKDKKVSPTANQLIWIHRMREVGYFADVAYGCDEAWRFIMNYLKNPVDSNAKE